MKKKCILPVAVAALMLLPLLASAAGFLNRITYAATYNYNNLSIGTDTLGGVTYATIGYEGLYNGGAPGTPSLPIDYIKFSVPYNATNFTVTATRIRPSNLNLDYLVYPCQVPQYTDGSQAPPVTLPDTAAYFSGNPYPTQVAWIADEGFLAGENHIVTVAVMPLRYTHTTSSDVLSLPLACNLVLRYDLSDSLAMYPIVRNDSLLRDEGYQLTQTMVVNPGQVKGFAPAYTFSPGIDTTSLIQGGIGGDVINGGGYAGGGGPQPLDSIPSNGVDTIGLGTGSLTVDAYYPYLIVTTPELKHAVRRIAALKRQKGYNVKVVTMDEVLQDSIACRGDYVNSHIAYNDNAGKLRQFLRGYYNKNGTQFVLLAGDIPYKYNNIDQYNIANSMSKVDVPSDLYYSDLTADWSQGEIDREPELYVGRVMATNYQQILNYTDKLYRYELNPGKGDYDYLTKIFYTESIDFERWHELDSINRYYSKTFSDTILAREIINTKYPSGTDIINKMNTLKASYISILNHGSPSGYITYGRRVNYYERDSVDNDVYYYLWAIDSIHYIYNNYVYSKDPHIINGLNNLDNKWYPSVCYSSACTMMPFDKAPGYSKVNVNFGESFTTGKDYGGPAFLGNTREGFFCHRSTGLERQFADQLSAGYSKVGMAEAISKSLFEDNYIIVTHNLLGEPEFDIWTCIPQTFSIPQIIRNNNSINILGVEDSTLIAICSNDNTPTYYMANSSNISLNGVSPNSLILLYKKNHIPFIAPLELQNCTINTSQYVIATDVYAGKLINTERTRGNVSISSGVEYEIESSGTVFLDDGFIVEKGATFAVYPSCF